MHTVAGTIGFFSVFLLVCIGFFLVGLFTIREPKRTAKFFNGVGSKTYGKKTNDRFYSPNNVLWAAWPFVIFTPFGATFGIYQIVHSIVTGVAG